MSLAVKGLDLALPRQDGSGLYTALADFALEVATGETVAVLGASASGKSLAGLALMGLTPPGGRLRARLFELEGERIPLERLSEAGVRGRRMGWVPQSAALSLDPMRTVGAQLREVLVSASRADRIRARVEVALERAGLEPTVGRLFPHALSGGMAQRAALALAWVAEPAVLIADEPTTALDGPTRLAVLDGLRARVKEGAALVLVTHDLSVALNYADRWVVMYAGRVVAAGEAKFFLRSFGHPHVQAIFQGRPEPPAPDLERERPATGCAYAAACPRASRLCREETPRLQVWGGRDLLVACHHPIEEGCS